MHGLIEEQLTGSIIGAFFEVYNTPGFGFLEHIYVMALERELIDMGHHVSREMAVNVIYKGEQLANQRMDMVVDGKVVVETKSSLELHKTARRQLYNYLKATNMELGLFPHFGERAAFYRVIRSNPKKDPLNPEPPQNPFELP